MQTKNNPNRGIPTPRAGAESTASENAGHANKTNAVKASPPPGDAGFNRQPFEDRESIPTLGVFLEREGAVPPLTPRAYWLVQPSEEEDENPEVAPGGDREILFGLGINTRIRELCARVAKSPGSHLSKLMKSVLWQDAKFERPDPTELYAAVLDLFENRHQDDDERFKDLFCSANSLLQGYTRGLRCGYGLEDIDSALMNAPGVPELFGHGWAKDVWFPNALRYEIEFGDCFKMAVNHGDDAWTIDWADGSRLTVPGTTVITAHRATLLGAIPLAEEPEHCRDCYEPIDPDTGAGAFFLGAPLVLIRECVNALQGLKQGYLRPEVRFDDGVGGGDFETAGGSFYRRHPFDTERLELKPANGLLPPAGPPMS